MQIERETNKMKIECSSCVIAMFLGSAYYVYIYMNSMYQLFCLFPPSIDDALHMHTHTHDNNLYIYTMLKCLTFEMK